MATFEVMLLDTYTIEESIKRQQLVARLRSFATVAHDELTDSELSSWLWSAALVIRPEISSWEELASKEEHGVLIWAAIAVTDARMMESAQYFPIKSRVGETDPSKRVESNVKIKQQLMAQWNQFLNNAGITLGDEIVVGELFRRDQQRDIMVPFDTDPAPKKVALQFLSKTATTATLKWGQAEISDFYSYLLYVSELPNIHDITRMAEDTNTGVRANASLVGEFVKQHQVAALVEGLTAGKLYYFVLAVEDLNGKVSVSNEVKVQL